MRKTWIRQELDEHRMSVYQAAKLSKIPYSTLADIVAGRVRLEFVDFLTAGRLAMLLGLSLDDLASRTVMGIMPVPVNVRIEGEEETQDFWK